jgi:DNA mismatch endonuclease (patch repair protein)
MRSNRRTGTKPEVRLRSALHGMGLRFRKDYPIRTAARLVRPDVVFTRARVAVFVDGCFWHACSSHGTKPKSNTWYWGPKLERNVERDREVDAALSADGWDVVRVWEHEVPTEAATRIRSLLVARSS